MESINFIKKYNKPYLGIIDNLYYDNDNHNYFYYYILSKINKQKDYIILKLIKEKNKFNLEVLDSNNIKHYYFQINKLYYQGDIYEEQLFSFIIKYNNNKLIIKIYSEKEQTMYDYPIMKINIIIPKEFNEIKELEIINSLHYNHPYITRNKRINVFIERKDKVEYIKNYDYDNISIY